MKQETKDKLWIAAMCATYTIINLTWLWRD
jgi:hypothetical protein